MAIFSVASVFLQLLYLTLMLDRNIETEFRLEYTPSTYGDNCRVTISRMET